MSLLTLAYSSLAERAKNIKVTAGYESLLVIQNPNESRYETPEAINSDKIYELTSSGVAKSRNKAIELCQTKYLVFADDDIEFVAEGLRQVVEHLEAHPEVDIVLAQASDPAGKLRKSYPAAPQTLTLLNSARAATYEMVIRVDRIKELALRFDENFGAGVENYLGDEYIFITDLIRVGGRGEFLPVTIANHPAESSGSGWGTQRDRIARARVFKRVFGFVAPAVRLAFGLRRVNELGGLGKLALFVLGR